MSGTQILIIYMLIGFAMVIPVIKEMKEDMFDIFSTMAVSQGISDAMLKNIIIFASFVCMMMWPLLILCAVIRAFSRF